MIIQNKEEHRRIFKMVGESFYNPQKQVWRMIREQKKCQCNDRKI